MSHELQFSAEGGATQHSSSQPAVASGVGGFNLSAKLAQSAHPIVCVFHCIFKISSLCLYAIGGLLSKTSGANFITVTVCSILLLALDFWVVKNITGRLLVGLRWWNKVEGETTRWIYESAGEQKIVNKFDHSVFWTVLYVTPLVWSFFLISGFLQLEFGWLIIVLIALSLSSANVYGYYKCSSDQKAKLNDMMQRGAQQGAMGLIKSGVFNMMPGGGGNA